MMPTSAISNTGRRATPRRRYSRAGSSMLASSSASGVVLTAAASTSSREAMSELTAHGPADLSPIEGEVDDSRRKFLLRETIGMGVVGAAFTATPFIESWLPSERARALGGPTAVDVTKIDAGQMIITIWRRQPIYVTHRTPELMSLLGNHDDRLKDAKSEDSDQPAYCQNPIRSRNAEYLVLIGICTHLGCLPKQRFDVGHRQVGA